MLNSVRILERSAHWNALWMITTVDRGRKLTPGCVIHSDREGVALVSLSSDEAEY